MFCYFGVMRNFRNLVTKLIKLLSSVLTVAILLFQFTLPGCKGLTVPLLKLSLELPIMVTYIDRGSASKRGCKIIRPLYIILKLS